MATPTIKPSQIITGPGMLRFAPLGSTLPTPAVTASVFSHSWDPAWKEVGATDEGVEEGHSASTDAVEVAESYYPVRYVTTGKEDTLSFAMAHLNLDNWRMALNAASGSMAATGTSGTTMNVFTPPLVGAEVRVMLAWQSTDDTELLIGYQAYQTGNVTVGRRKGADKALLTVEFRFELPDSAVAPVPFRRYYAGTKWTA